MTNNIIDLIREDLRNFQPYSSARRETVLGRLWLNANESPWRNSDQLNRYPDPQPQALLKKLADFYTLSPENILMTRGSDEAIDLLMRLFCEPYKDTIIICPPTYGMYEVSARLQGAKICFVPLLLNTKSQFEVDINSLITNCKNTKLIFLCSPNNPTGNIISQKEIVFLCEFFSNKALIIVDEAYIEYTQSQKSLVTQIKNYKNLIILRTFSKAFGLAGLRCGVLLGETLIIKWLNKIIAPYPISTLTTNKLSKILMPNSLKEIYKKINIILTEKQKLFEYFLAAPFVETVWPSEANFLLVKIKSAKHVFESCLEQGIVLRYMGDKPGLENCIRISIGLPDENKKLITFFNQKRF